MREILLLLCLFVLDKSHAFGSDTLQSERLITKDTLIIKSEYTGCTNFTQKEVRCFYDGAKMNVLMLDSPQIKFNPRNNLSSEQRKIAERILKKYMSGQTLSTKEKNYVRMPINNQNSLFNFSIQYLKNETIYLETSFEAAKQLLIDFEKTLTTKRSGDKNLCIGKTGSCRTKVTMTIKNEKREISYYSDGCDDSNALIRMYIK